MKRVFIIFFLCYTQHGFLCFSNELQDISKEKSKGEQETLCQIYYIRNIAAIVIALCDPDRNAKQRMELCRQL